MSDKYPEQLQTFFKTASLYADITPIAVYGNYVFYNKHHSDIDEAYFPGENFYDEECEYEEELTGGQIFDVMVKTGRLTPEYAETYKKQYVPILLDEIGDWEIPFNALVVDLAESKLPVYFIGWSSDGELVRISSSLTEYIDTFLKQKERPGDALKKGHDQLHELYKNKNFEKIITLAASLLAKYEKLKIIEDRQDNHLRRLIGGLYNYKGIAEKELGTGNPVSSFEEGFQLGNNNCLLNLIDYHNFISKDFEKARELARKPVYGKYARFYKIKGDAYASLNLGDMKQAEYCYKLIEKEHFYKDDEKIAIVKEELSELGSAAAEKVLDWFCVEKEISDAHIRANRAWWTGLSFEWQAQFKILLAADSGVDARKKAGNSEEVPGDRQLFFFLNQTRFTIHDEFKVNTFKPLSDLKKLEKLTISYQKEYIHPFVHELALLSNLPALTVLNLSDNELTNADFLCSLKNIKELELDGNQLSSIDFLKELPGLTGLKLTLETDHADLSPLSALSSCKELEIELETEKVTGLEKIGSLTVLEKLSIEDKSDEPRIGNISFLKELTSLKKLNLERCAVENLNVLAGCKELEELSVESEELTDIEAIKGLTRLKEICFHDCEKLAGLSALADLTEVTELDLAFTKTDNIDFVTKMKELKRIDVGFGYVTDISPLKNCPKLQIMNFKNMEVKKITGLDALTEHPDLFRVYLDKKAFGKKAIDNFKKRFPEVSIG